MPLTRPILYGEALHSAAEPWKAELSKSDAIRLEALVGLALAERIRLSDCLATLFPGLDAKKAQPALASFRKRLNDAADEHGLDLHFHVDTKKQLPPTERACCFTGPDPSVKQAERYSDQVTVDVEGKPLVRSRGIATTGGALEAGKRLVRFFVSYAHQNKQLVDALVKELRTQFGASKRYAVELWRDGEILVGERWDARIKKEIESCTFGLFFVSPAFLASEYISREELPRFVRGDSPKPVIPVGLVPVLFGSQDLKGLERQQLFLRAYPQGDGRFYDQMRGAASKRDFAQQLFLAMEKRLDAFFTPPSQDDLSALVPVPDMTLHFQRTRGLRFALADLERIGTGKRDHTRDAIEEIEAWASRPDGSPFFALLGEYGIGKTTTLKQFTRDLLEKRKTQPELPLPIYVDLRDYVGETQDSVPTIEQLLARVIERSWKLQDRTLSPRDILRLVREEGAIILFDGLDEKLVHLSPVRARDFIRTLWAVLPAAARSDAELPPGKRRGKLLISCRSHYFRDVWSQNALLVGEDREGINRDEYPAFCLLPFTEEQIRTYLSNLLESEALGAQAFSLICSIHNLRDLSARPYLLTLIGSRLGQLEDLKARGETVNAARLYDLVVRSWLSRDDGKHQLEPQHKRRLMEELAAALWRDGRKQWGVDHLEEWFDQYLADNPVLAAAYANKDRAVLKEDLRTATFILRPSRQAEHFRFAHTSIQEYFLAAHLARALEEGKPERWDLPLVSRETLDFIGQLLTLGPRPAALRTLERILQGGGPRAAVLAFRYWLRAIEQGLPAPAPARVKLAGANLEEWIIRGGGATRPLNLREADLSGVRLNRARVEHVDLADANLEGLEARQALFLNVSAPRARAAGVDLRGLRWREGSLLGAGLRGARLAGCQWIGVGLAGATLPETWWQDAAAVDGDPSAPARAPAADSVRLVGLHGHAGATNSCAWSPDGRLLLSGSDDNSLKVWDAASGQCLLTLCGHSNEILACAWSPDGRRVLSGAADGSLKVWDATSGHELLTLSAHSSAVSDCAFSPEGQRLLSGSRDRSLSVWDAASGHCLLTLRGHSSEVLACAWSPDGQRILSGSDDSALKVWDAASGQELLTLTGHTGAVRACAFSPDGRRLVSGSDDSSLEVWDAASGRSLLTLRGHLSAVMDCGWSPDGQRLVSGSYDRSLRIWNAASGQCLLILSGHSNAVMAAAWSPDGQRLVSGCSDGSLEVRDAASGQDLLTLPGHSREVLACAWSPDGQRLVTGSDDSSLKVWDAAGQELLTLSGHSNEILACAWSPDGQRLLSGSDDRSLKVWDAASGQCLLTACGHTSEVLACGWSPDSQRLLSGSSDRTLKVWDAASGQCLLTLGGHGSAVMACGWSPDGRRLLSGSYDRSLKIWDALCGKCLRTLCCPSSAVMACAWSPDGAHLASGATDGSLAVWDAASGKCLRTLSGHTSAVMACAWSPDGRRLLSSADDSSLKIWDAGSGQCLRTLAGHSSAVGTCAWSPDGQRLLSGADDSTLKVWDADSGQCLWTGHIFPERQTAALDEVRGRILSASREAWRWLGWRWTDPATGRLRLLPAETFGPLPLPAIT